MDKEKEIGAEFINRTKHKNLPVSDQVQGVPFPPLELEAEEGLPAVTLPRPEGFTGGEMDVRQSIESRRSIRSYAETPISLDELSYLLWCTQGVTEIIPGCCTIRNVPSAGARHALETYLLVNNVKGVPPGLYRFLAIRHGLVRLSTDGTSVDTIRKRAVSCCLGQKFVAESAVTMIWTAISYRMTWRYGERGYRYIHLDAGHVCQNLYLSALSIGCGACAIAAFDDDALSKLLGIDGEGQFPVYLCSVGKMK